ncbi:hypothetical protein MCI_04440 [Rickettsia montanensis str. OSU 85-930]|uniref:Tetratricopeptide repeat-containing protein n=2 Tax=Rickettsia montanensis TaxID=33991 RepID=H8KBD3_RICMS|nr:hypothetical protein MCI_04440 [Rickettsia montanensis str. OSU 85-930]
MNIKKHLIYFKQYKGFLHIYYYKGITYLCWGEYYNNVEQTDLYLKAVASLRQAALYTSKPKDTDFLLGKALYKAGKLSKAGTVLNKYISCPENEEEFQEILSQITPELNKTTNSPMLSRDSSQLTSFHNKDSHDIIEVSQTLNALISIIAKHDHDIARHAQAIADIKKCYNLQMLGMQI